MKPIHQADKVDNQLILAGMRRKKLSAFAPTLIIGIPSRGKVSTEFTMSLVQLFNPLNMVVTYVVQKGMLPAEAREEITKYALEAGAKYIFFIDDDMLLPPDTLYRLNQRMQTLPDAAIVSGIYSSKFEPVEPFVYKEFGAGAYWGFKKNSIEQVWAVGAGCLLVNLEYVKKMKPPYWLDEYGEIEGRATFLGQDINFCHKIQKEAGGRVYIDSAINCGHQDINSGQIFHIPEREKGSKNSNNPVDIIIPCWNQLEYTKKCIESIQKNTNNYNLILIDNGSTDGTAEYFKTLDATVITNKENLGFVKAVNQGFKASKNDVVILNNDTEVPEGWLDKMKEVLTGDVGAVGPLSTAPMQEQYYKEFRTKWKGLYLTFFCTLIKREVIDKVGYLDENFEIGLGDDQDYCNRMALAGYRTRLRTDVIVKHHHRVSIKEIPNIEEISRKNHEYLKNKWEQKQAV
jgi:GT2 family glycosyltransferase